MNSLPVSLKMEHDRFSSPFVHMAIIAFYFYANPANAFSLLTSVDTMRFCQVRGQF